MRLLAVSAAVFVLAAPALANSADPELPTTKATEYSPYEREAIDAAVRDLHASIDPAPEGKILEDIDVVTLDVFEPRDPYPEWANVFHATTRHSVVEREVLLHRGDRWSQVLVDETARNLRLLPQLSVVLCIALRGSTPDRVRLLVITKDLWSLRLTTDFALTPGGLEDLAVQLVETNLLGRHQSVGVSYEYTPDTSSYGALFTEPRLFGSRVSLSTAASVIVNRTTGTAEGTTGSLALTRPLFSTRTEWAWSVYGSWDDEITRRYTNAHVAEFALPGPNGAPAPAGSPTIPDAYRSAQVLTGASVTRSFGWRYKNDFTGGWIVSTNRYSIPDEAQYDPVLVATYRSLRVPTSDDRSYPYLQWHSYTNDFLRVLDFERLALQEDFSLGHNVYLRVYPVAEAFGSSRTFFGTYAGVQYTVPFGDGLARATIESRTEAEKHRLSDAAIVGRVRVVTPRLGFGRLVYDGEVLNRYRNYLNAETVLGGDTRLRGYPTGFFFGNDFVASNLELRTAAVEILKTEFGAAAFYDVGDAFRGFSRLRPHASVGFGVRILFPQFNRTVFRTDIAFPIDASGLPPGVKPVAFFASFDQAFSVPTLSP